jgi:hypothetical protein
MSTGIGGIPICDSDDWRRVLVVAAIHSIIVVLGANSVLRLYLRSRFQ